MNSVLRYAYTCFLLVSLLGPSKSIAQQVFGNNSYQTFASSGTTNGAASDGANIRLYSAVGQPMAINSAILSQTQAGILSAVSNGNLVFDNISPTITSSPSSSFKSGDAFTTHVTDNVTVAGAKIHFKPITVSPTAGFDSLALASGTSNAYSIAIQNGSKSLFDAMGIEYYYTAVDEKGNYKRDPTAGSYYSYQTISGAQLPATLLSSGIATTNYRIIALPYSSTSGDAITSLFGSASGLPDITDNNGANWRLGHYDNSPGIDSVQAYPDNLTQFKRGFGYWFISRKPVAVTIGQVTAPTNNRSSLFQLNLLDGWNMIGNPYPVDISWPDVQGLPGNSNVTSLKVWNGGWSDATTLAAFQGGFVKNSGTSTLKIPFPGQTAEGGRVIVPTITSDISAPQWKVALDIFQDDAFNKLGGFGMAPNSHSGPDELDDYNPPAFLDSPEINFNTTDPKEKMCLNMVAPAPDFVWKFKLKGVSNKLTELTWSSDLGTGIEELYLVDESQATVIDMRQQNTYHFTLKNNQQFSIYFGKDVLQKIAVSQLVISSPYPNPVLHNETTFNLGLPDVGGSYYVNVQVFNSAGVAVNNTLLNFDPGIKKVIWQPTENNSSGIYYYRVVAHSGNVSAVSTGKIILP